MEHNQNMVAPINHERVLRIKFHDHSFRFHHQQQQHKLYLYDYMSYCIAKALRQNYNLKLFYILMIILLHEKFLQFDF